MCVEMNWLLLYLFVTASTFAMIQASLAEMKLSPDTCFVTEFTSLSGLNNPEAIASSTNSSLSILGTSTGLAYATSQAAAIIPLQNSNPTVGGIESDADGKILFTDIHRNCIRSYDPMTTAEGVWAGECGIHNDNTGADRISDDKFTLLYDLAANSEKTLFYVNEQRTKIKVISTVDDTVAVKVEYMQDVYALAVAANGDLYFSAKKALYVIAEDSNTPQLVAGILDAAGLIDGTLTSSKFQNIFGIVFLEQYNWVIISDTYNRRLRIIDIDNDEVTSLCAGTLPLIGWQHEANLEDCGVDNPKGLILLGDRLLLVETTRLKEITCSGDGSTTLEQTVTSESETTTTAESETTITAESETTTTAETETTTTAESETTIIGEIETTTVATKQVKMAKFVGNRTATSMWLEKGGKNKVTCSGTLARHFSTEQSKDCMMACVVSPSCCCLSFGNGVCEIYHL